MDSIKKILVTIMVSLSLFACEKDVVLDLADLDGAYLIVEANIIDDGRPQWIKLSWSSSYYDAGPGDPVSGADVMINDGGLNYNFFETVTDSLKGYYFNNGISAKLVNENYSLTIKTGEQVFSAKSTLKPVPVIDSVTVKLNPFSELGFGEEKFYDVFAHFKDLPEPDDHYLFNLYINRNLRTLRPTEKSPVSDENLQEYVSLSVITLNERDFNPGDTLTLEIRSISKENFDFYNVFFFQTDLSGNPFAGAPPANIPTNMSEGARGFFQVSKINRTSVIFQPSE